MNLSNRLTFSLVFSVLLVAVFAICADRYGRRRRSNSNVYGAVTSAVQKDR